MKKKVHEYLTSIRSRSEPIHFTLIDPEKFNDVVKESIKKAIDAGTDAFLIGGSLLVTEQSVNTVIDYIRSLSRDHPVIIFPGNVNSISPKADAIFFMSLLNSDDPYFIIGAQVLGAPIVKQYGLEPLPTAYIIVGKGGAAGYIGKARPIPLDHPEIAAAYALAAEYLGMKYIYLEAGSGSEQHVPLHMIRAVKSVIDDPLLIVGGGIRDPETAAKVISSGADAIVTGNIVERDPETTYKIISRIKRR